MLLLGLILCCGSAVVHALKPNLVVCSVARIASGTSYAIVYATLLVKLVFLVSLNGGVYLPATYQSLLLCFAILIQVSASSSLLQLILGSRDLSYAEKRIQAFLDFRGFDFRHFRFTAVYNSILFSSPLVLLSNLDLCDFPFLLFLGVPPLTA